MNFFSPRCWSPTEEWSTCGFLTWRKLSLSLASFLRHDALCRCSLIVRVVNTNHLLVAHHNVMSSLTEKMWLRLNVRMDFLSRWKWRWCEFRPNFCPPCPSDSLVTRLHLPSSERLDYSVGHVDIMHLNRATSPSRVFYSSNHTHATTSCIQKWSAQQSHLGPVSPRVGSRGGSAKVKINETYC